MIVGAFALLAPLVVGRWSLAVLGFPLIALSLAEAYTTFRSPSQTKLSAYLPSILALGAAALLLLSSSLVLSGLVVLLSAILVADGLSKILILRSRLPAERGPAVINALIDFACAALLWYLSRGAGAERIVGFVVGALVAAAGWRIFMATSDLAKASATEARDIHPDPRIDLPPSEAFARLYGENEAVTPTLLATDLMWMVTLGLVFFAIHFGRMPTSNTLLGIVSPVVATGGDLLMTLVFAALVVLPARLLWRRLTRPAERLAWSLHLGSKARSLHLNPAADWLIARWLAIRFGFSMRLRKTRESLSLLIILLLRLGLPVTAFFVAFNPVWGFTWYFNTESWATGVYQKMTELRVDPWRISMTDAISRAYGGDGDELLQVRPEGIDGTSDFSFIVIGDPGEGDASQFSLVSRYLNLGARDDVKFLVVSSDVIYPAGAMSDYENNFYLPFQGFAKPIYAIPGNHDWFDALEGFNANFLEPKAARAAIEARIESDLGLTTTTSRRIDQLLAEAARLRRLYGVRSGMQRAVYFELQTNDFALLAFDTGILRTIDARQWAWIDRALGRSQGKFTMAIVGHPRFAGGHDIPDYAEGHDVSSSTDAFAALYRKLESHGVRIAMAGDTHDFEYYRQNTSGDDGDGVLHHFVNGGGGAYLSIGTALDFPDTPAVPDWAFYPRSDQLRSKLDTETPAWKQPFWYWIKWFRGWPFSVEALSGLFDFNRAPFFQSFLEVRVERSKRRVVVILNGTDGPLRWRDLQVGGGGAPLGAQSDLPVEFIVPFEHE